MSRKEIRLQRRVRDLEGALQPFARFTHIPDRLEKKRPDEIFVPTEGDVWLYVGTAEPHARAHLHTDDFQLARSLVRGLKW